MISVLLAASLAAAPAPGRARIIDVRATADGVEVRGDRPLSFTTLRLAAPPRIVVDVADADVEPRELAVEGGAVRRVGVAEAGTRTARIVIELATEAEFDVRAEGAVLDVRLPQPGAHDGDGDAATRATLPTVALVGAKRTPPEATPAPAQAETPAPAATPAVPSELPPPSEPAPAIATAPEAERQKPQRKAITSIGFRPTDGGAVIVRSDAPLEVGVSGSGHAVLLHLPHAAIPLPNNRRPLDTRFFGSAVERVVPLAVAGGTDVRIELREDADYRLEQSGAVLTVTFSQR